MTTAMAKQAVPKSPKAQGFDPDTHECFMNVSDPTVWMDDSNDLVCILSHWPGEKSQKSSAQLRFTEGGELSSLEVWSANGKRCLGHLDGKDLALFLARALDRMGSRTPSNSPSMTRQARKD